MKYASLCLVKPVEPLLPAKAPLPYVLGRGPQGRLALPYSPRKTRSIGVKDGGHGTGFSIADAPTRPSQPILRCATPHRTKKLHFVCAPMGALSWPDAQRARQIPPAALVSVHTGLYLYKSSSRDRNIPTAGPARSSCIALVFTKRLVARGKGRGYWHGRFHCRRCLLLLFLR